LYGAPTNLPWKIFIAPQNRLPGLETVAYYHPLFLYESLWNFANFLLLMWLSRKHSARLFPGDIFLVYLIVYPFGRFMLEFLRLDPAMVGGININQTIMLVVGILAAATLIWRHVKKRPAAEATGA
jgi:phosphatidylglycerol:prolipoprotein diacylglycerol transferase